jgi:hypothetical protein
LTAPDLLAESQARENHAACLAAQLPVSARGWPAALPGPDRAVFGDWAPCRDPVPHHSVYRICFEHGGISWYGTEPCWVCSPLSAI